MDSANRKYRQRTWGCILFPTLPCAMKANCWVAVLTKLFFYISTQQVGMDIWRCDIYFRIMDFGYDTEDNKQVACVYRYELESEAMVHLCFCLGSIKQLFLLGRAVTMMCAGTLWKYENPNKLTSLCDETILEHRQTLYYTANIDYLDKVVWEFIRWGFYSISLLWIGNNWNKPCLITSQTSLSK